MSSNPNLSRDGQLAKSSLSMTKSKESLIRKETIRCSSLFRLIRINNSTILRTQYPKDKASMWSYFSKPETTNWSNFDAR